MGLCVNLFEFNNKLLWYIWYYNDKFEKYLNLNIVIIIICIKGVYDFLGWNILIWNVLGCDLLGGLVKYWLLMLLMGLGCML